MVSLRRKYVNMISKKLHPKTEVPDAILDGGGYNGKICEEVKKIAKISCLVKTNMV